MHTPHNVGAYDRMIRLFLAELSFLAGFFWFAGALQFVAYALTVILAGTALIGTCPAYIPFGINTSRQASRVVWSIAALTLTGVAVAGAYYSAFFTKKFFLEDFNAMNGYYKQTLFLTGQGKRDDSVAEYERLVAQYGAFAARYTAYRPYVIRGDAQFGDDLARVHDIVAGLSQTISNGDLAAAHTTLESVRPIFQDMLKRNGLSMLSVYLVDFHDAMETVLDAANGKDASGVLAAYTAASERLAAVESVVNDSEIQAIRGNLEHVRELAESGSLDELPKAAGTLKSSFVAVYLARG